MSFNNYHQGSQAFNHMIPGNGESVNGNTGTFNFSKSLIDLPGISEASRLRLDLIYVPRSPGGFGLPDGWTFKLPFVLPDKSLTIAGRTYVIDFEWADTTNYKSGLRYVNDHGMRFLRHPSLPNLPHDFPGQYAYSMKVQDGTSYYFDTGGKLILQEDIHGTCVYYSYVSEGGSTVLDRASTLKSIQDSWGQIINIDCQPGLQMLITGPDGGSYTIQYLSYREGVSAVVDPIGNRVTFQHLEFASENRVMSAISYPTGLRTQFNYVGLPYLDNNGVSRTMPAVQDYIHLDENGALMDHTSYSFFSDLGPATYTGSVLGYKMNSGSDSLMDSNNLDYR